ncbi:MAG: hypothetical protein RCG15_04595 [Candidatus Rickettsia vulgarisii]
MKLERFLNALDKLGGVSPETCSNKSNHILSGLTQGYYMIITMMPI